VPDHLESSAGKRPDIHPAVVAEAGVLIRDQGLDEQRIDIGQRGGQAPAAVGDGKGAEQDSVAIEHKRAGFGMQVC
jgi:hypothetical protein